MTTRKCDYCRKPFEPKKPDQRFCVGNNCRQKWHREHTLTGRVAGIRALKSGGWSITVHQHDRPDVTIGSKVRVQTDV